MSTASRLATAEPVRQAVPETGRSMPAVVRWAWVGALLLAAEWFFIGKWVLGDKFKHPEIFMGVKGQEFPAYDPRGFQGMGVAYY